MAENQGVVKAVTAWPMAVKGYVQELQLEMHRVTWPSWKQVRATTLVVVACVFSFAAYFYVVDLLIGRGITKVFSTFSK